MRKTCFETRREAIPCEARSRQRARLAGVAVEVEIQGFTPRMGYGEGYLFRSPADLVEKMLLTSTTNGSSATTLMSAMALLRVDDRADDPLHTNRDKIGSLMFSRIYWG